MNVFSDSLTTIFEEETKSILISHLQPTEFDGSLVNIRLETYGKMTFDELSAFLGSRLLLLMPSMREFYKVDIDKMIKD
jgi:hypothetical protein